MEGKARITAVALAAGLVVAAPIVIAPARAQAAGITECANYVPVGWAHGTWTGYWTFRTVPGFTPVSNLTTRNVRCSDARTFSIHVSRTGARRYHNFNCRVTQLGTEDYDIRCTRGSQVVHWQGGV